MVIFLAVRWQYLGESVYECLLYALFLAGFALTECPPIIVLGRKLALSAFLFKVLYYLHSIVM